MVLTVIVPQHSCSVPAISQPTEIDYAHWLFEIGKFVEAGEVYARIADQVSKNYPAVLQLGNIALLSNRLDDARKWLEQAITLRPGNAFGLRGWRIYCANVTPGSVPVLMSTRRIIAS